MKPSEILTLHRDEILACFARHPKLSNLRVFGSVARGEDTENSDIDFLINIKPGTTLIDIGAFCSDLQEIVGDNFDLTEECSLPTRFKEKVLREAIVV